MARFSDGSIAEPDIPLVITIEDENDNPPYFELHTGNITERSQKGALTIIIANQQKCFFLICLIDILKSQKFTLQRMLLPVAGSL